MKPGEKWEIVPWTIGIVDALSVEIVGVNDQEGIVCDYVRDERTARLIASLPNLVEALRKCVEAAKGIDVTGGGVCVAIRAGKEAADALRKAGL